MSSRDPVTGLLNHPTLRWLVIAIVAGFSAGGAFALSYGSKISRAEAGDMLAPVIKETHGNSAAILTISTDVHVLLGRDSVRYLSRKQELREGRRDDAELQAIAVFDEEVLHGIPVEIAKATALQARIP